MGTGTPASGPCDATWCVFSAGTGANRGDECICTIPAGSHPTTDQVEGSCFQGAAGNDLTLRFSLVGYQTYAVSTCQGPPGDSSIAAFDGAPTAGGAEIACNEDALVEVAGCSKITDPMAGGEFGAPTAAPTSATLHLVVDERDPGTWWNGTRDREIVVELLYGWGCGDGVVDTNEACDDGNEVPLDGCDPDCNREGLAIRDCDPTWCTWVAGAGIHGGDLCTCTIPGSDHPLVHAIEPSCAKDGGREVLFDFDTSGYASWAVSTCTGSGDDADSVVAVFDGDPLTGSTELACFDNAVGETTGCTKVWDPGAAGAAAQLVDLPGPLARMTAVVDGGLNVGGQYWDRSTTRVITFEFSTTPIGSVCGDGLAEPGETCDDGNLVPGDGCGGTCQRERLVLNGCDPAFCSLAPGSGSHGGDVCSCAIPGVSHPTTNEIDLSCISNGREALMALDLATGGYDFLEVTACPGPGGDFPAVALFDGDPAGGAAEIAPNNPWGCPCYHAPTPTPASGMVWVALDEDAADYWDGLTTRSFTVELIAPQVCGDGSVGPDEACDDGNLTPGDGCDASCADEPRNGCDPRWCVLTPEGGPHGGDLCTCTLEGADHPQQDSIVDPDGGPYGGNEVALWWDTGEAGYARFAVDTCTNGDLSGDSMVWIFNEDPALGTDPYIEIIDGIGEVSGCADIFSFDSGPPTPNLVPTSDLLWVVVDEDLPGSYWDGVTTRSFTVELLRPNDCGNGVVEFPEQCDDSNTSAGDGCDWSCNAEFIVHDCDPTWCTWAPLAGPNGGDLCTCTIPADAQPTSGTPQEPDCLSWSGTSGNVVVFDFDVSGYASSAASTCEPNLLGLTADSTIAIYDAYPSIGATELACADDAVGHSDGCTKYWDPWSLGASAQLVDNPPGLSRLWYSVGEDGNDYWNGTLDRVITFEFSTAVVATCGDGVVQPGEVCDDGNVVDGDGCSATCR